MFKKYPSLENSYRTRTIQKFTNFHPLIEKQSYLVTEKIDGANIQLFFTPDNEVKVGSRNKFIQPDENFYDIHNVLKKYEIAVQELQQYVNLSKKTVRVFGEIYGEGIQKRIDYGPGKAMAFFDVEVDGELLSPYFARLFIGLNGLPEVPMISIVSSLADALVIRNTFNTLICGGTDEKRLVSEGTVIRPYYQNFWVQEELFALKNKNEEFKEKMGVKPTVANSLDSKVVALNLEFKSYITKNRLLSVFSKKGQIENTSQIGEYIKAVIDDAKEEFVKDHDVSLCDAKELKSVYSCGNMIILLLKEYL